MRSPFAGVLLVVALLAASGGGYWLMQRRAADAEIEALLAEADHEILREEIDRSDLTRVLRKLAKSDAGGSDARLIRARARLQLRLELFQDAWDTEAVLAGDPGRAEPEDLLLGATILKRLQAMQGSREHAALAMRLAEEHYDATAAASSLLLAWQCAERGGRLAEATRLAERLTRELPESWEGRVVKALQERDPTQPEVGEEDLRRLAREGQAVPEEVDLALAFVELQRGDVDSLDRGTQRLKGVLETFPACVDARSLIAGALLKSGAGEAADVHLRWLLEYSDADDERRSKWQQMLDR